MAEYYLSKDIVETSSTHEIHKDNCDALPELNTMKYLGSYGSKEAALTKSRGYFDQVSYCSNCLPE